MKLTGIRWNGRTAGIGTAIVATAVAGTATMVAVGVGDGAGEWAAADGPVATALRTVDFPAANGREVTIPQRDTDRFALVGVTWANPKIDFKGTISVRTRAVGGGWSGWLPLEIDSHFGPEPGTETTAGRARGSTDPRWVGPSDGVEVRAVAAGDRIPAGLRLELVDPGQPKRRKAGAAGVDHARPQRLQPVAEVRALEPTPTDPAPTDTTTTAPAPTETTTAPAPTETTPAETTAPPPAETTAPAPTTASAPASTTSAPAPTATNPIPTPKVVTRAEWKADESIVTDPPTYGTTVKAFFVHHTAGTNDYSCADSAAIVRGIEVYHVKSNGWNDIGYNFLVDKCGVVFEGRKGGIDKPVTGAHTYGFNTDNSAIAVLGTYISSGIPAVVQDAVAHVAAYKLGQYGNDPLGKVTLTSGVDGKYNLGEQVVFNRISGHRDAVATECPGDALYGQLAIIRNKAASIADLTVTKIGANKYGTTYYPQSSFTAYWSTTTPTQLIDRWEILVDGVVVTTVAGDARSAVVPALSGQHTVKVRGVHKLGRTVDSAGQSVYGDQVLPVFASRPEITLRTGTVNPTGVPVTLGWKATDDGALRSVSLTGMTPTVFAPSTAGWSTTARSGIATTWSMTALDWAGNTGSARSIRTPMLVAETSATRSGTWSTTSSSSHLGRSALTSTAAGASLTWTVTGRSAAFIASRTSTSGQVDLYVDGAKVDTIDLRSDTAAYRQAVWTTSWSTSGTHTVTAVVVGTTGRPAITADGIAYVK